MLYYPVAQRRGGFEPPRRCARAAKFELALEVLAAVLNADRGAG